jgi:SpoVK/Ycf46/Vps4 family AAA+-type ATPase
LFVSPAVAASITNPEFLDLLIDNPNSVLVIEDAENIIQDRRYNHHSSVSNLLNISDGLLSDFLNVQLICTFNCELQFIDQALLRKGRLIAKYEFGKLETQKAQHLSRHLGYDTEVLKPMTLSEIINQQETLLPEVEQPQIGFRRMSAYSN